MDSPSDIVKNVLKLLVMFCIWMLMLVAIVALAAGLGRLVALPFDSEGNGALFGIAFALLLWLAPRIVDKVGARIVALPALLVAVANAWSHRRAARSPGRAAAKPQADD